MSKTWHSSQTAHYGNQRRQVAEAMVKERRTIRAKNKRELKQLVEVELYDEESLVPGIVHDAIHSVKE